MSHTEKFTRRVIFVVVSLIFTLGFGIDLYSPAFPAIASTFQTSEQLVQLTVTTYFFGYFFGMVVMGPALDTFGRKRPILLGLFFYFVMSLLCSFAQSIEMLLVLRFFQGLGVTGAGIGFRSILTDSFTGRRLATSMTYSSMSYRIGPVIAPFIGGYLTAYFGWQSNFYFLALYSALLIGIVWVFLPETHTERVPYHPQTLFHRYFRILKQPHFFGGGLCLGTYYGMMVVFPLIAPFFIQDILGYSPITFGHISFLVGIFAFLGMFFNRVLLHKLDVRTIIPIGVYTTLFISFLQVVLAYFYPINLFVLIIPVTGIFFMTGLCSSNFSSIILENVTANKGLASALVGIMSITTTNLITAFSSFLKSSTIAPFSWGYFSLALIAALSYQFIHKKKGSIPP